MNFFSLVVAIFVVGAAVEAAKFERLVKSSQRRTADQGFSVQGLAVSAQLGKLGSFRAATDETYPSAKGVKRYRLTQTYDGLDVHGASAEAEMDLNGQLTGQMYGQVCTSLESDIPDPSACVMNCDDMINMAITTEGFSTTDSDITDKGCKRMVYVDQNEKGHLSYRVEFFYASSSQVTFPAYFFDACNSEVLASFNQVQNATVHRDKRQADDQCETDAPTSTPSTPSTSTPSTPSTTSTTRNPSACPVNAAGVGGNPKTGQNTYNTPPFCLNVRQDGATCYMENTYARVIDNEQSTTRSKNTVVSFTCTEGYSDPVNEAFGVASDAMFFGDITGRLYVEKYNVRALPYAPRLVIHYDSCYDNAFWNGVDMFFGDGCSYFYPLVNQDVVTHELGHGITSRNSNLEYRRESGGINEAFSDISGEVAEVFGRASNDWQVGRELFKGNGALRYFINPPDDRRSIKHVNDYRDGMDVHYSSGIYNHAFYQLVAIQGMDIYQAYECFLEANLLIWRATTGFQEGACGVLQSAFDNGYDLAKVRAAFSVVGVTLNDNNCALSSLSSVVHYGSERTNIKVSATRKPVIELDVGDNYPVVVSASNADNVPINVLITSDLEGTQTMSEGTGSTSVNSGAHSIFVTLSTSSDSDVMVTLSMAPVANY